MVADMQWGTQLCVCALEQQYDSIWFPANLHLCYSIKGVRPRNKASIGYSENSFPPLRVNVSFKPPSLACLILDHRITPVRYCCCEVLKGSCPMFIRGIKSQCLAAILWKLCYLVSHLSSFTLNSQPRGGEIKKANYAVCLLMYLSE